MLYENSDEPYCEEIAKAITDEIRKGNRVDTTTKLREIIEKTLDFLPEKEKKDTVRKTCQRVFQALRIDVNREFEVLYEFMEKLPDALKPGGRVAILTFHSGEDKLVKKALKAGYKAGIYSDYAKDVNPPIRPGMCPEWTCPLYQDALGSQIRILNKKKASGRKSQMSSFIIRAMCLYYLSAP